MLRIGGILNIIIAFAHIIGLFWAEQFFANTGAKEGMDMLTQFHPLLPHILTVFVAIVFFIFGLYGLSADDKFRKLPFLKLGIFAIAAIYLFRGIGEQAFNIWNNSTTSSETIQSIVAIVIGLLYLIGGLKKWKEN